MPYGKLKTPVLLLIWTHELDLWPVTTLKRLLHKHIERSDCETGISDQNQLVRKYALFHKSANLCHAIIQISQKVN